MTAPHCSTFLYATTAPDFPNDISALWVDRPTSRDPLPVENRLENLHDSRAAATTNGHTVATSNPVNGGQEKRSVHGDVVGAAAGTKELSLELPPLDEEEKRQLESELRDKDPYYAKLAQMKDILDSIPRMRRRGAKSTETASSSIDATRHPGTAAGPKTDNVDASQTMSAAEVARHCDQLVRQGDAIGRAKTELQKKALWNESGVSEVLCPDRMEKDVEDLERVVDTLQHLTQNESKMAVYLQKPPTPCLRLDPLLHEDAVKVLGGEALKTALDVVEAADDIEKFIRTTSEAESGEGDIATVKQLTDHLEREKNHLAHALTAVKKATVAKSAMA